MPTIIGAYEHQHRNKEIHHNLDSRRDCRRTRRSRLRRRPARFNNRANARTKGRLPPSIQSLVDDTEAIVLTMRRLYPVPDQGRVPPLRHPADAKPRHQGS